MTDDAVKEFARWIIQTACFEAANLDGGEVQEKAIALGLLREEPYDPAIHGASDCDILPGEPWFVFSDILGKR